MGNFDTYIISIVVVIAIPSILMACRWLYVSYLRSKAKKYIERITSRKTAKYIGRTEAISVTDDYIDLLSDYLPKELKFNDGDYKNELALAELYIAYIMDLYFSIDTSNYSMIQKALHKKEQYFFAYTFMSFLSSSGNFRKIEMSGHDVWDYYSNGAERLTSFGITVHKALIGSMRFISDEYNTQEIENRLRNNLF